MTCSTRSSVGRHLDAGAAPIIEGIPLDRDL